MLLFLTMSQYFENFILDIGPFENHREVEDENREKNNLTMKY